MNSIRYCSSLARRSAICSMTCFDRRQENQARAIAIARIVSGNSSTW